MTYKSWTSEEVYQALEEGRPVWLLQTGHGQQDDCLIAESACEAWDEIEAQHGEIPSHWRIDRLWKI